MTTETQSAIYLRQYKAHTKTVNGQHQIKVGNNLMDVFTGTGWTVPTRYRLIRSVWVYQHGPKVRLETGA